METRYALLTVFLCLIVAAATVGVAGQSPAEFTLESDSTVTTPPQTVSNQFTDGELTVRKTAVVEPDEKITGTATVPDPDEQTYFVQFRNSDRRVVDDTITDGAETSYEFNTSSESPGSYAVNIWDPNERTVKSVLPVVIASHEVSSIQINNSSPSNADVAPSETAPVIVSLEILEATTVERVNLTVWDDDEKVSTTLDNTASNEYEGTLPALDEGEYQIQVRVRGGETVNGRPSLIGLSEANSLTVSETQGPDDDNTNTGSSGDDSGASGGSNGSTGSGENPSDDTNSTDTSNTTDDSNSTDGSNAMDNTNSTDDTNSTDGNSTDSDTSVNGTDTGTDDSASNGTSDATDANENDSNGTIAPNNDTVSPDGTDDSTPLYAVQMILLTVVLGGALHRFRRTN